MYYLHTTGTSSLYTYMFTGPAGRKGLWGGGCEHRVYRSDSTHALIGRKGLGGKVIRIEHLADRE